MEVINKTTKYPLYPQQISKFEFNRKDFGKMKNRIKRGKFNRLTEDDYNWEYKFIKNNLHVIRKDTGVTLMIVPFEKEENKITVKMVEVAPQMDTYIQFNGFAIVTFKEKIQIFISETFQLLQRWIKPHYTIPNKFIGKKICIELNIECPKRIVEALKDPILVEKCHMGRWFLELKKNWIKFLYSYPFMLVGVLINAEVTRDKENEKYVVKKIFIDQRIRYANPRGQDNDKRTTEETAVDVINECFKEIDKNF